MAHHKRTGPKSTRAGCLLCKPQKRQGAPKKTRKKISELRKISSANDTLADTGAEPSLRDVGSIPRLPSGRLTVIWDEKQLKRFDRSLLGPVVLFNEAEYNVNFESGCGKGFNEFLEHAKLITRQGEIIDRGNDYTIGQMLNLDAPMATYPHSYTVKELLDTLHEGDRDYFTRQGITLDDIKNRLSSGYFEDLLTTCCGNPGCGSTHVLIRDGKCDVLFEVSAWSLVSVEFFAFEIVD